MEDLECTLEDLECTLENLECSKCQQFQSGSQIGNRQTSNTQTSTQITPGQKTNNSQRHSPPRHLPLSQLSLPPLSPIYPEYQENNNTLSDTNYAEPDNETTNFNISQNFTTLIPKILPSLIQLIFAETITDKIQCLTELGRALGFENLMTSIVSSLKISSMHPS